MFLASDKFIIDETPAEPWEKSKLQIFIDLSPTLVKHCDHAKEDPVKHMWESMSFFFCKICKNVKAKFLTWMQDKLNKDLQEKHLDYTHHKIITNWRELTKHHKSFEVAVEDEISGKCRKGLFL